MRKKEVAKKRKGTSRNLAIASLLVNVLLVPCLGTLIGGRTAEGILQVILLVVGLALSFVFIGIPIVILVWIWGLVTGVQLVKEAQ